MLLLGEVVAVVSCHKSLESLQFILREPDILQEASLALSGRRLGAEESRKGCHSSHKGQDGQKLRSLGGLGLC